LPERALGFPPPLVSGCFWICILRAPIGTLFPALFMNKNFLFLFSFALFISAVQAKAQKKPEALMPAKFFEKIESVARAMPFASLKACGDIFSTSFGAQPQPGSNEVLSVFLAEKVNDSWIEKVELRANFERPHRCQLLNLSLQKPLKVTKSEVDQKLKVKGVSMGLSQPHNVEAGAYVVYVLDPSGVELRVGFSSLAEKEVVSLSFDNCRKR
jgi:hypothetical protein